MSAAYKICSWLVVALGCAHLAFTFHNYDEFSMDAFWFAGAGFAIVFAGFLNVALIRDGGRDKLIRALCLITNISCALLFVAALTLMRQPQVFAGAALFAFLVVAAVMTKPQRGTIK